MPPRPGAFSALGLLCTDVVHDYIRSELRPLAEITPEHAEDIFRTLEAKAREELAAEGMNPADGRLTRELDLRYTGQGYELRTPLDGLFAERLTADSLAAARSRFDERHAQIHGHAAKERAGRGGELSPAPARRGPQIRAAGGDAAALGATARAMRSRAHARSR